MITTQGLAQAHEALVTRCDHLGLDEDDTELLKDLLGWNNGDRSLPRSYRGLEPYVSSLITATKNNEAALMAFEEERERKRAIVKLLYIVLGDPLVALVKAQPAETLKELGLPRLSVVWLIAQF